MVNAMRLMLLGMLAAMSNGEAALEVSLNTAQSKLGEPLALFVTSDRDLSALDLSPLAQNFELASQTYNRAVRRGREEHVLELSLYPLRSGVLRIPGLSLDTERSRELSVRIEPGDVAIQAWFPPGVPMAREAIRLSLEIRDDGSYNWITPIQVDAPYTKLRALPESTRETVQDGRKYVVRHFEWQVLPLREGSVRFEFAMLEAYRAAQRLRFPVGGIALQVRSAPAYLPVHLPIGRPLIRSDPHPENVMAGKRAVWSMDVHAPGLSVDGLKSLLRYTVPPGLEMSPPSVIQMQQGDEEYLRVTFSFQARANATHFPEIQLPYFDLRAQRIEILNIPSQALEVRNPTREKLVVWGSGLLTIGLLSLIGSRGWRRWQQVKVKHKWLAEIRAAESPEALYALLTRLSPWRVPLLRQLPAALEIEKRYADLHALRFGNYAAQDVSICKNNVLEDLAATPAGIYPQQFLHCHTAVPDDINLAKAIKCL